MNVCLSPHKNHSTSVCVCVCHLYIISKCKLQVKTCANACINSWQTFCAFVRLDNLKHTVKKITHCRFCYPFVSTLTAFTLYLPKENTVASMLTPAAPPEGCSGRVTETVKLWYQFSTNTIAQLACK